MSVQKNRLSKQISFSIISNKVAQGLNHNLQALGLYTYLFSMPEGWEFYKNHIQKECGIGIKLLNKLFKILENHGLIEVKQIRDNNGYFSYNDIKVLDGNSFKINPYVQNGRTVTVGRQRTPINKHIEINKKKINTTKEKKLSTEENLTNLFSNSKSQKPALRSFKSEEQRPQPKLWGPGNEDYDRVNGLI